MDSLTSRVADLDSVEITDDDDDNPDGLSVFCKYYKPPLLGCVPPLPNEDPYQ